ncbi:MAG: hypothetical protein Q9173_003107 [Seirophora scorigena]
MPSISLSLILALLPASWIAYSGFCLLRNYQIARKIGVPLVVIPISHENPLWMVVDKKFVIPLFERFPFGTGSFTRYNWRGWEFADKSKSHVELGDVFVVVTPDASTFLGLLRFLVGFLNGFGDRGRQLTVAEMVNIFGPNLSTTDGQQWQRHRKITATCFNEQNNELVWSESFRQAQDMLRYWSSKESISSIADDTRTLSLHVLSAAGFGRSFPFQGKAEASSESVSTSYKDSLQTILDNCILLMILGQKFIAKPWLPDKLRKLHLATITFKKYMTDVYEEEKKSIAEEKPGATNLMTSLIRASAESTSPENTSDLQGGLTESEIYGNVFVFNFAGHDTTAHTLAFAIVLLAAHPSVQDWVSEELRHVLSEQKPEDRVYQRTFPRLKRCLAVLYETLRLYSPVPIAKYTGKEARELRVGESSMVIPANTMVIPSHVAVHTHPRYWGQDAMEWCPSRWIEGAAEAHQRLIDRLDAEVLTTAHKGSFVAWSEGIRNCPGKKFSQVEFVATMAALFRDWRVDPIVEAGENDVGVARKRVMETVEKDTGLFPLPKAWSERQFKVTQADPSHPGAKLVRVKSAISEPPSAGLYALKASWPEGYGSICHQRQIPSATPVCEGFRKMESAAHDPSTGYLYGWRLAIVIVSLFCGAFLIALDTNVLTVANPKISSDFHSLQDLAWYGSAYLLTLTAFQPVFGSFCKYFNTSVVYRTSILVFEGISAQNPTKHEALLILFSVGSVLCATASSSHAFIVGRTVAGLGAAGVLQGTLSTISHVVELEKRPLYMSIVISVFVIAVCGGPPLGGVLTQRTTWRWCFWINLPIGALVLILVTIFIRVREAESENRNLPVGQKLRRMDPIGGVLFVGAICCLIFALQWGGQSKPCNSPTVIGLLLGFFALTGVFGYWQWQRKDRALIPLRVLRKRSIWTGAMVLLFLGASSDLNGFFLPFYFQAVQGVGPSASGVKVIPLLLSQIVAVVAAGAVVKTWGHYPLCMPPSLKEQQVPYMLLGECICIAGTALLSRLQPTTPTVTWASYLVVAGLGMGMAQQLPYTAVQVTLRAAVSAIAIAIGQTITINTIQKEALKQVPGISVNAILTEGAANLGRVAAGSAEALHGLRQVWSIAIDRTMLLSVSLVAASVPFTLAMEWVNATEIARQRKEAASVVEERRRTIEDDDEKAGKTTAVVVASSSS